MRLANKTKPIQLPADSVHCRSPEGGHRTEKALPIISTAQSPCTRRTSPAWPEMGASQPHHLLFSAPEPLKASLLSLRLRDATVAKGSPVSARIALLPVAAS